LLLILASHDPVIGLLGFAAETWGAAGGAIAVGVAMMALIALVVVAVDQFRRGHLGRELTRPLTSALNIFSVVLLVLVLLPALPRVPTWFSGPSQPDRGAPGVAERPPDIYLFLLDGYSRADELERQFGIDNTAFLDELRNRGFDVDDASRTNYTYTSLTLTSLLTMDYLRDVQPAPLAEGDLGQQLRDAMQRGAGRAALHTAGYEIVASAAGWEGTSLRPLADRYLDRPELTDFERALLARTWIPDVPPVPQDLFFDHLRTRIDGVLDDAARLAQDPADEPTFTLVHVPAPHLPIAFMADGSETPYDSRQYLAGRPSEFGLTEEEYAAAYAGHVAHLNRRVLETVDVLMAADEPPVIVLMSDHGYNGDSPVHTTAMLHNLFAAHTPGRPGLLEPSPTPVNLLRTILGAYTQVDVGRQLGDRFFTTVLSGEVGNYDLALTEVSDP